jgi:PAS domain S-box-containing protein
MTSNEPQLNPAASEAEQLRRLAELEAEVQRADAALRNTHERLMAYFAGAPVGLAIHDKEGRITHINDTLVRINGVPREETIGKTIREVIPKLAHILEPIFERVLKQGESVRDVEIGGEVPGEPGIIRHWVASYFPIKIGPRETAGVGAIVVEVTERKRALQALERERARLQQENAVMFGRETRIIELKQEVNALLKELNRGPRYSV